MLKEKSEINIKIEENKDLKTIIFEKNTKKENKIIVLSNLTKENIEKIIEELKNCL